MRNAKLAVLGAALAGTLAFGGAPAQANIVWDLSTYGGNLGPTSSYTSDGYTITATGWLATDVGGAYQFPISPTDLYGKQLGGDEDGLGIANDPSGDHEIYFPSFIQIDVSDPYAAGLTHYQFEMGSSTQGEQWSVFGSNQPIANPPPDYNYQILYDNYTDELTPHDLSGYKYYLFLYTGPQEGVGDSNVLLYKTFAAIVPEPSTWALMGLGFAALAFVGYRRANGKAVTA